MLDLIFISTAILYSFFKMDMFTNIFRERVLPGEKAASDNSVELKNMSQVRIPPNLLILLPHQLLNICISYYSLNPFIIE